MNTNMTALTWVSKFVAGTGFIGFLPTCCMAEKGDFGTNSNDWPLWPGDNVLLLRSKATEWPVGDSATIVCM